MSHAPRWTGVELGIVRATYPTGGLTATRAALTAAGHKRSDQAITFRAYILKANRRQAPRWTRNEDATLRNLYGDGEARDVHAVKASLPHRTLAAIRNRASNLKMRSGGPSLFGDSHAEPFRSTMMMGPTRSRRINDRLHDLAETPGLTPALYDSAKRTILEGNT